MNAKMEYEVISRGNTVPITRQFFYDYRDYLENIRLFLKKLDYWGKIRLFEKKPDYCTIPIIVENIRLF
jgi:hypothetical protein